MCVKKVTKKRSKIVGLNFLATKTSRKLKYTYQKIHFVECYFCMQVWKCETNIIRRIIQFMSHILFVLDLHMKYTIYVRILCGLLSCDSSLICKKCSSCLCISLHSWWWFGISNGIWDFFTLYSFSVGIIAVARFVNTCRLG